LSIKNDEKYSVLMQTEEQALKLKEFYRVMIMKKMDDMATQETPRNMLHE